MYDESPIEKEPRTQEQKAEAVLQMFGVGNGKSSLAEQMFAGSDVGLIFESYCALDPKQQIISPDFAALQLAAVQRRLAQFTVEGGCESELFAVLEYGSQCVRLVATVLRASFEPGGDGLLDTFYPKENVIENADKLADQMDALKDSLRNTAYAIDQKNSFYVEMKPLMNLFSEDIPHEVKGVAYPTAIAALKATYAQYAMSHDDAIPADTVNQALDDIEKATVNFWEEVSSNAKQLRVHQPEAMIKIKELSRHYITALRKDEELLEKIWAIDDTENYSPPHTRIVYQLNEKIDNACMAIHDKLRGEGRS